MSIYISNSIYLAGTPSNGDINENNPILGYHSILTPDDFSSSYAAQGGENINMWSPDTASMWIGENYGNDEPETLTQFVYLKNPNNETVNYIGIARHNFGSQGLSYKIQYTNDGRVTWNDITDFRLPSSDDSILIYFDDNSAGEFRIFISFYGLSMPAPRIAHVKLGIALVLQRRIYVGHMPATLAKNVKKTTHGSESGQYLGQVVHRSYYQTSLSQENNSPAFVRENIVPFINHVNGHTVTENTAPATFFFAWRPSDYPDEVIYGWTGDNIQPENQGGDTLGGRMSWSCNIEAVA